MLKNGFADNIRKNKHLVAYVLFFTFVVIGFLYMERLANRLEYEAMIRAHDNCMTNNETREVVGMVLDALVEPRPDDGPGDFERRQEQRERVDPLLATSECPPSPGDHH